MTALKQVIQETPLANTHEHQRSEEEFVNTGPDVLQALFDNYVGSELIVAGASLEAVQKALDGQDPDVEARWNGIKQAYENSRFTGYGRMIQEIARLVFGMETIDLPGIEAAAEKNRQYQQPGGRLHLLQDVANLAYIQVDDFTWPCQPDPAGPDFFLYDINWESFASGTVDMEALHQETGVEVRDLATLQQAMAAIFDRHAACAIAVKSQHAYTRTLFWQKREDADASQVLQKQLRGETLTEADRLCLGDWCWARGVELATAHNLPFKMHTGYLAGHSPAHPMVIDRVRPAHLSHLLNEYTEARFVLMHISYPYDNELIGIAKHFPNVYADMCWAWSMNPYVSADFVRRWLHAVPINKLFVFGGDSFWPYATVAYAQQARDGLYRALQAEVDDGWLVEADAIAIAKRVMGENQAACFDLDGTRAAIHAAIAAPAEE